MFVLVKSENGHFVAPPGSKHSYTPMLQSARFFSTREEAERHRCSNESIRDVNGYLPSTNRPVKERPLTTLANNLQPVAVKRAQELMLRIIKGEKKASQVAEELGMSKGLLKGVMLGQVLLSADRMKRLEAMAPPEPEPVVEAEVPAEPAKPKKPRAPRKKAAPAAEAV